MTSRPRGSVLRALGALALAAPFAAPLAAQGTTPPSSADRDRALERAEKEAEAGHPAEAARVLRDAALRFHSVKALLQLARLQADQKDVAGAVESLRQARAIAPNSEEVLSASADAALAAHDVLDALSTLEALTRLCPTVARYHYEKGMALLQAGDTAAAVVSLKEARRLEPSQAPILIGLGTALVRRELYAEARPHLLDALSLGPDDAGALAALATAEQGLGELEAAEGHAQRALSGPGAPVVAKLALGMVRMKQERCAQARDVLLEVVAADPASAPAHQQLGLAYACLDDPVRSRQHLEISRKELQETEDLVRRVRAVTGFSEGATP